MARRKKHKDVEYHVDRPDGSTVHTNDPAEAALTALSVAMSRGEAVLDVVVWSESGARAYGGDDAVEQYREDPEASVFDRFEIKVNNVGRVP